MIRFSSTVSSLKHPLLLSIWRPDGLYLKNPNVLSSIFHYELEVAPYVSYNILCAYCSLTNRSSGTVHWILYLKL